MAILTVTFNPAIDLETHIDRLQPAEKLRCSEPSRDPGGGGINVARAIQQLGGKATALLAAGGPSGAALEAMLVDMGIPVARLPAPGETRQNLSVIEVATGAQYRFIFPGPAWSKADAVRVIEALNEHAVPGDIVVLSGSMPVGVAPEVLMEMIGVLAERRVTVVADTSGAALAAVSDRSGTGLTVLRMDSEEAKALNGAPLPTAEASADMAEDMVARGIAQTVILARGAEGSVLATADGRWFAPSAKVPVRSRTGAGDSFVAGAVLALERGEAPPEILRHGCAAASAAVTTEATELCDRETMLSLLPHSPPSAI